MNFWIKEYFNIYEYMVKLNFNFSQNFIELMIFININFIS